MRKLFIGGLDYKTSEETLKKHFERFGDVIDCVVMREPQSKRSRGFGFVIYASSSMVDEAQKARPHQVDGREVQSKRAISREDSGKPEAQATVKKVYLGGLSDDIERDDLEDYFRIFGNIVNINIVSHKDTGKRRGFAFVEYDDYDPVDKIVLKKFHTIKERRIEAKKAIPKIEMDARRRVGPLDPRAAALANSMMALAGAAGAPPPPLESILANGTGAGMRARSSAGGRGANGSGSYLTDRIPYFPADYSGVNLDGYSQHHHYNAALNWMMDGAGVGPQGGLSASSYGHPSRGAHGRSGYVNHVPNWAAATAEFGTAFGPSSSYGGGGGANGGVGAGGGPMRLSYQYVRFGPYGSNHPGGSGSGPHRGRGFKQP